MKLILAASIYFILSSALFAEESIETRIKKLSVLQNISDTDFNKGISTGLWNNEKTALAITFHSSTKTICLVIITLNNKFIISDVSQVESGNFGKLGTATRNKYEKYKTFPTKWLKTEGDYFQIEFTTQAWKNGQRYTLLKNHWLLILMEALSSDEAYT